MRTTVLLLLTAAGLASGLGTTAGVATAQPGPDAAAACDRGEVCLWDAEFYGGQVQRFDLTTIGLGECVPLPDGVDARSLADRGTRPVSVYQGRDCSTEGDFTTYPGGGTYVPQAPFVVRAIEVWDH